MDTDEIASYKRELVNVLTFILERYIPDPGDIRAFYATKMPIKNRSIFEDYMKALDSVSSGAADRRLFYGDKWVKYIENKGYHEWETFPLIKMIEDEILKKAENAQHKKELQDYIDSMKTKFRDRINEHLKTIGYQKPTEQLPKKSWRSWFKSKTVGGKKRSRKTKRQQLFRA